MTSYYRVIFYFQVSEWMNSDLPSHKQRGHTETGPRFRDSFERPEKRGIDLAILAAFYPLHYRRSSLQWYWILFLNMGTPKLTG